MATKLDKFNGKIDFSKDSKAKISKTLGALEDYLNEYSEDEAAKIIHDFSKSTSALSADEAEDRQKLLTAYKKRTEVLQGVAADVHQMQKDLIDEQKSQNKNDKASWSSNALKKIKGIPGVVKGAATEAKDFAKDPLKWLKDKIFGKLLKGIAGKVMKLLMKPLKWIVKGLFKTGKFGAKLIFKSIRGILRTGLKAGGWILGKFTGVAGDLWEKYAAPKIAELAEKIKGLGTSILDKGKELFGKGKAAVSSGAAKVAEFFKSTGSKLAGAMEESKVGKAVLSGINTAKGWATTAATKTIELGKAAGNFMSNGIKSTWKKLKSKVMGIGKKLIAVFTKKGGAAAGSVVAKKLPSILGKFASKFIPGVGWALLAYDVYSAFKKSHGAISFAVNLIDEVTGGLLGMAVGAVVEDFDGENLGEYVQKLVKGFDLGLSPDEMDVTKDVDMKSLDAQSKAIDDLVNSQNNTFDDPDEVKKLETRIGNNPNKQKVLDEYIRLQNLVQEGELEPQKANDMLKNFMKQSLTEGAAINPSNKNPETGQELANNSDGTVEQVKQPDVNIPSMDVSTAQQIQAGLITMKASMGIAADTAAQVASSISDSAVSFFQQNFTSSTGAARDATTIVQG